MKKQTQTEKLKELRKIFDEFCINNDFMLNPDKKHTDFALEGVLKNEKETGLRFCPCQIRTENFEKDITLLCPCNFKVQKTWTEKDRCWCGLFVKRK